MPEGVRRLLDLPSTAHLASLMPDGAPHISSRSTTPAPQPSDDPCHRLRTGVRARAARLTTSDGPTAGHERRGRRRVPRGRNPELVRLGRDQLAAFVPGAADSEGRLVVRDGDEHPARVSRSSCPCSHRAGAPGTLPQCSRHPRRQSPVAKVAFLAGFAGRDGIGAQREVGGFRLAVRPGLECLARCSSGAVSGPEDTC